MHEIPGAPNSDRIVRLGEESSAPDSGPATKAGWNDVPWRSIVGAVLVVLATYLAVVAILLTARIVAWIVIAGFFAIVLSPAVSRVQAHTGNRRSFAAGIVVFATVAAAVGMLSVFLLPVRTQLVAILTDLPGTINDAADGHRAVGKIVTRLHLNNYVKGHEQELKNAAAKIGGSSFDVAKTAVGAVLAVITIIVIIFLFLSQSEGLGRAALGVVPHRHRDPVRRAAIDAAHAVSGYMIGNLLISLVAGATSFVCLLAVGVPSPFVIALWVAFADLLPLVGATLGAVVGVLAAFLQGATPGIVTLVFFIVYQQIENSVLYPAVMARKVKVNPLVVLLSVLLAAEVFGLVGALLAVPASGALQVVIKAVRKEHLLADFVVPSSIGFDRTS
jgi:predicted PurR-regulated permease PerM